MLSQKYIMKIESSRFKKAKWKLDLTFEEAMENKEIITLASSQCLRWIDELTNKGNYEIELDDIKRKINKLKNNNNNKETKEEIRKLYERKYELQFCPEYLCVVMESIADYNTIYEKGITLNGVKYKRLLGTTGGVKNQTIVFVSEKNGLVNEIRKRIDNGRNMSKKFNPSKLEAYRALSCSASTPVSMPKGILVVNDCITHFTEKVINLDSNDEDENGNPTDQPNMKIIEKEIEQDNSDGYGMGRPSLMERWGYDLGENRILADCVIRNSFCKGSVVCIDFVEVCEDLGITMITDVWGNVHDIHDIELVLTESMLKLWDSYSSIEDYISNCEMNNYSFAITKTMHEHLENERNMNYQFLQSYDFSDEDIEELVNPTIDEINDIMGSDYKKTLLYLKGESLDEDNIRKLDGDFATALMLNKELMNDSYVQAQIATMIRKRINDVKIGVIKVDGNYIISSGDPYALCQSMCGLEVTGLLKAGEVYCKYWLDKKSEEVILFRAPMTCHNNIRKVKVATNELMDKYFRYANAVVMFNAWDCAMQCLNGQDHDGDANIMTDNGVLLRNTRNELPIVCEQKAADKKIPTEDDLFASNKNGFGNGIGSTTNKITSMFDVMTYFSKDSEEYKTLEYRIKCGQLYQQDAIDKIKGIKCKPMPTRWYNLKGKDNATELDMAIVADKKPYFMRYIYPELNKEYEDYIKANEEKSIVLFGIELKDLIELEDKTEDQNKFVEYYFDRMPTSNGECVVNRICRKVEKVFPKVRQTKPKTDFDYNILKADEYEYDKKTYNEVYEVFKSYQKETTEFMHMKNAKKRVKNVDNISAMDVLFERYRKKLISKCPNKFVLLNIIVDICYKNNKSKQFVWNLCGDTIIEVLLAKNNYEITFPVKDENGDIEFRGEKFRLTTTKIEKTEEE